MDALATRGQQLEALQGTMTSGHLLTTVNLHSHLLSLSQHMQLSELPGQASHLDKSWGQQMAFMSVF